MKKICLLVSLLLLSSLFSALSLPAQDIADLNTQLHSPVRAARIHAAKIVTSSGIQDQQLYETINDILLTNLDNPSQLDSYIDEMAWMCKALASSGDPKYQATLKRVLSSTKNSKLNRYARQSIDLIPYYAERVQTINQPGDYGENFSAEDIRIANMLKSNLSKLKKDGAKKLIRSGSTNLDLYDIAEQELLKGYATNLSDREHIDTMAWLCKALSASGDQKYAATLSTVAKKSSNTKLQQHALRNLKQLQAIY